MKKKIIIFMVPVLFLLMIPTGPVKAESTIVGDFDNTFTKSYAYLDSLKQEVYRFKLTNNSSSPANVNAISFEQTCGGNQRVANRAYIVNNKTGIIIGDSLVTNANYISISGSNLHLALNSHEQTSYSLLFDTDIVGGGTCLWTIYSLTATDTNAGVNLTPVLDNALGDILTLYNKPDLIIEKIDLYDSNTGEPLPTNIPVDTSAEVKVKVKNQGAGPADKTTAGNIIISADTATWPNEVTNVGGVSANNDLIDTLPLAGGQSFEKLMPNIKFTKPGSYQLKYLVDAQNVVTETNENNNSNSITINVSGKSDLAIDSLTISRANPKINEDISISLTLKNVGTASIFTSNGITDGSNLNQLGFKITGGKFSSIISLAPGEIAIVENYVGHFTSAGIKEISFNVSSDVEDASADKTNNKKTAVITVQSAISDDSVNNSATPDTGTANQGQTDSANNNIQGNLDSPTTIDSSNEMTEDKKAEIVKTEMDLVSTVDKNLTSRLAGRILLQVQNHGEAWYLDSNSQSKFYLADGSSAYQALRKFGLGITNDDISKIPIGTDEKLTSLDSDNDGLDDKLEETIGTDPNKADTDNDGFSDSEEINNGFNPKGTGRIIIDNTLGQRLAGKIVLQVQSHGEAWYINPVNNKRYYMKNGNAAYQIMRFLSLGITNSDLRKIAVGVLQ